MRPKMLLCFLLFLPVAMTAQEITVFSGFWGPKYYEDDKQITTKELKSLFSANPEVAGLWKRYETNATLSGISFTAQLGFAVWTGIELGRDDGEVLVPAIGTVATSVIGAIFFSSANKNARKAILTYNKQFDTRTSYRLVPLMDQHGLGLALRF